MTIGESIKELRENRGSSLEDYHVNKYISRIYSTNDNDDNNKNNSGDDGSSTTSTAFQPRNNKMCKDNVLKVLKESPVLKYIIKDMVRLGCLPPIIKCAPCKEESFGYFEPEEGIVICDNIQNFPQNIRNTVVHEMVHAYDMCKVKLDTFNCQHLACTEIRAANLSGDCKWEMELIRGQSSIFNHLKECTKRRAVGSLQTNPLCRDIAQKSVDLAWDKCNVDYSPFQTIPKNL
ncbi:hypothetical protein CYY_003088 [Polysphondylium violaceum]|uniref:Mitochondrial inner membrane protease ATP23 n=1 Tax=Polysphondylium violaceum TaxID=133409 RepID=A0A8J4PY94_9MYCE|nr:hypothetical protein CYY_003088 [Polysphondylium violaceum]